MIDGRKIGQLRKERELTLEKFEELSGVPIAQLSRFESGERRPSMNSLSAIAKALKVSTAELFARRNRRDTNVTDEHAD